MAVPAEAFSTTMRAALTVNKCTFTGNSANDGEGAIANYDGTLTVNECTFVGNSSDTNGAGEA